MKKNLLLLSVLLGLGLCVVIQSCDDDEKTPPAFTRDEAMMVMESLDTLIKKVIEITDQHTNYDLGKPYAVDANIAGLVSGQAKVVGADSLSGVFDQSTQSKSKKANFVFSLDAYANSDITHLNNEGSIRYNKYSSEKLLCPEDATCPILIIKEQFIVKAPALEVTVTKDGKQIKDVLEIDLKYQCTFRSEKNVVKDSTVLYNYSVKNSSGAIFSKVIIAQ